MSHGHTGRQRPPKRRRRKARNTENRQNFITGVSVNHFATKQQLQRAHYRTRCRDIVRPSRRGISVHHAPLQPDLRSALRGHGRVDPLHTHAINQQVCRDVIAHDNHQHRVIAEAHADRAAAHVLKQTAATGAGRVRQRNWRVDVELPCGVLPVEFRQNVDLDRARLAVDGIAIDEYLLSRREILHPDADPKARALGDTAQQGLEIVQRLPAETSDEEKEGEQQHSTHKKAGARRPRRRRGT